MNAIAFAISLVPPSRSSPSTLNRSVFRELNVGSLWLGVRRRGLNLAFGLASHAATVVDIVDHNVAEWHL